MINRTMVRTRVVQTLFAYYQDGEKTPLTARKELLKSYTDTYNLYHILLDFVSELTSYAASQIEQCQARAKATHTEYTANRNFVDNKFADQIFRNYSLRNYMDQNKLGWDAGLSSVNAIYRQLIETPYYKEYMSLESPSYEDDKRIWRKIYTDLLPDNEELLSGLDEMEIVLDQSNWTTDLNVVLSYVVKTVKRMSESSDANEPLLMMFDNESELDFGKDLLHYAIEGHERNGKLVASHLKNWDADRIAYMDKIILEVTLAEILNFPEIALEVTLNEYIEIAKEYSGDKSYLFINGILDEILKEMRRENTLAKVMITK